MKFDTPEDIGRYLFDRAVTADMDQSERLLLAHVCAAKATQLWKKHHPAVDR